MRTVSLFSPMLFFLLLALLLLKILFANIPDFSNLDLTNIPPHVKVALKYVGVKEKGNNRGPEIEMFQKSIPIPPGSAYCAAFARFCLDQGGAKTPKIRSGRSIDYIVKNSIKATNVLQGRATVPDGALVIFRNGNTINGHTGIVIKWFKDRGYTVEGNTSPSKIGIDNYRFEAEGDGVYIKLRKIQPANYFRITHFTPVTY